MGNQKQVNEVAKKLSLILIDNGMKMLQSAFHLQPTVVSYNTITNVLRKYFPTQQITHLDNLYHLLPYSQWLELIRVDWVDTKKWLAEVFDCDNMSNAFASNMAMFFEINSAGRVYGKITTEEGKVIYHYWNVIITSEEQVWFLEPQNDKFVKYEGGDLIIGTWKYESIGFYFG